jgi:hypothetical protein
MSSGNGSISLGQAKYNRTIAGTPPSAGVFRLDTARTRKVHKEKEKKMGWFKRKFAQWSREAWESGQKAEVYATDSIRPHEGLNGKTSVRFTIYPASGGFVIEHYKQDRFKDGDGPTLTIVNSSEDIGQAVEHILAIEALKA